MEDDLAVCVCDANPYENTPIHWSNNLLKGWWVTTQIHGAYAHTSTTDWAYTSCSPVFGLLLPSNFITLSLPWTIWVSSGVYRSERLP